MRAIGEGIDSMGELIIVSLLAGGLLELIRFNGGMEYIIQKLTRHISSPRGASFSIAALVSLVNVCTANNTISIITVGPLARDIAGRFGLSPRRTASLMDIFSCVVQGILPYGAQLLMASGLAGISALSIIGHLYYPFALAGVALLFILISPPEKNSRKSPENSHK
ncbi:MAG: Na+/H+ antiporter NhaC family protein, partial [Bacteroidales bacterium]|nr:Na+/H+ antiporter NhaC family protein [Bacteroidales bacterium]